MTLKVSTFLTILIVLNTSSGCSFVRPSVTSQSQSGRVVVKAFQPGVTKVDEVRDLGAPSLTVDQGAKDLLVFCQEKPCKRESFSLTVNKSSKIIESVSWFPGQEEAETKLEKALAFYAGTTFAKQRLEFDYGHYFEESDRYSNLERGLVIEFDPQKNRVTQIYQGVPGVPLSYVVPGKKFPLVRVLPDRETASPKAP